MTLFSFTYIHPRTGQLCTVDSGKPTRTTALSDIVSYMRRSGLKTVAPESSWQIKDESRRQIHSSHGCLTVDSQGAVTYRHLHNEDADGGGHLARISRFDLEEWRRYWGRDLPDGFNILDLGYWYADPETGATVYAPPDVKWRKDMAQMLARRRRDAPEARMKNPLTLEQLDALNRFAAANGRRWKVELNRLWMTGAYGSAVLGGADPMHLQQIRNSFGPAWLVRFSLKNCATATQAPAE